VKVLESIFSFFFFNYFWGPVFVRLWTGVRPYPTFVDNPENIIFPLNTTKEILSNITFYNDRVSWAQKDVWNCTDHEIEKNWFRFQGLWVWRKARRKCCFGIGKRLHIKQSTTYLLQPYRNLVMDLSVYTIRRGYYPVGSDEWPATNMSTGLTKGNLPRPRMRAGILTVHHSGKRWTHATSFL